MVSPLYKPENSVETPSAAPAAAPAEPGRSTLTSIAGGAARTTAAGAVPSTGVGLAMPPGLPAPGATSFTTADGLGWIQLVEGGFECISAPAALRANLHAQVTPATDPARHQELIAAMPVPAQETYIVKPGDTPRSIAEAHGVTKQALLDANKDKIKWYDKDGRKVPGFEAGDKIVIPRNAPVGPVPPDDDSWWDIGWREIDKIRKDLGGITDGISDWVHKKWDEWGDWFGGGDDKDKEPAKGGRRLPEAKIDDWVKIAEAVSKARGKNATEPYDPPQMNKYITDLAVDQNATDDAVQLRVLAGVQFQFESAKRGTDYNWGSDRDYDLNTTFDCSEAVQWMMQQAGMGDIFGEAAPQVATLYMTKIVESIFGQSFRPTPRTGDIMMWARHVGMVLAVRSDKFVVSHMTGSGSIVSSWDVHDPIGEPERWAHGEKVIGFWSPESAKLPAPIGAAIVKPRPKAIRYFEPATRDGLSSFGAWYEPGEQLEVLKRAPGFALVHHAAKRSAGWVQNDALTFDAAAPTGVEPAVAPESP